MADRQRIIGIAAAWAGAGIAVYEAVALTTGAMPPITEIVEAWPEFVEAVALGGFIGWLLVHFGWWDRVERWIRNCLHRSPD